MKLTIGQLKEQVRYELLIAECRFLLERSTGLDRADKIGDLVRAALKDPYKVHDLYTYLNQIGTPHQLMQQLLSLMQKGNNIEIVAAARDLSCDMVGARPTTTGSGDGGECKPRLKQGKRAQMIDKVKGFFKRNKDKQR